MKIRTFWILLTLICVIGIAATAALTFYTIHLHDNVSIIAYIANERG